MKKNVLILTCVLFGTMALAYGPGKESSNSDGNSFRQHQNNMEEAGDWSDDKPQEKKQFNKMRKSLVKELDLSVEQLRKIDNLKELSEEKSRPLFKELDSLKYNLRKSINTNNYKNSDIVQIKGRMLEIQEELLDDHVKTMKDHNEILTAEQLSKLAEFMEKKEKEKLERKLSRSGKKKGFFRKH